MHLAALLLVSYAYASVGSPVSGRSQPVQEDAGSLGVQAEVERRGKQPDTILTAAGTFGPRGLLGSIDPSGNGVSVSSNGDDDDQDGNDGGFICFGRGCGAAAVVYLAAVGLEATYDFLKRLFSFHNNNPDDWPTYDDQSALWSVRTFRTGGCGRPGVRPGIDPTKSDHNGPYMMSEYRSTDLGYHDNQPCENFMFANPQSIGDVQVQSVAVWLHPSVTDGYILVYTNPVCNATVLNNHTAQDFSSEESDLVDIYDGTGALFQGDHTNSIVESGVWTCISAPAAIWNAFSVVQIGRTDMTVPSDFYENGVIPGVATQPKFRYPGHSALVSNSTSWGVGTFAQVGPAPYNELAYDDYYSNGEIFRLSV